jgi:hypothetical protein
MKHYRLVMIFALLLVCNAPVYGQKYKAPPEIIATLPKFCWAQYLENVPDEPEFHIQGCGAYANHFCPGLVQMAQAERETHPSILRQLLSEAKGNMEYTLNNTIDIPDCFLRPRAQINLQRIKFQIEMLKFKARGR